MEKINKSEIKRQTAKTIKNIVYKSFDEVIESKFGTIDSLSVGDNRLLKQILNKIIKKVDITYKLK